MIAALEKILKRPALLRFHVSAASILVSIINFSAIADDYILDPAPTYTQGTARIEEQYKVPTDPEVCNLYGKNLRINARAGIPMSCDRPIDKSLAKTIKKVAWKDLNPNQHRDLFRQVVGFARWSSKALSDEQFNHEIDLLARGQTVFRIAKYTFLGRPRFDNRNEPEQLTEFRIIRFGKNFDLEDPHNRAVCSTKGGISKQYASLYLVTKDLSEVYGPLTSVTGGEGDRTLLVIRNQPYVEEIYPNGDIVVSELEVEPVVILNPVCLFHFKN